MIYIFTVQKEFVIRNSLGIDVNVNWLEVIQQLPAKHELKTGAQVYLDITNLDSAEIKKSITALKKITGFWGIVDPKGTAEDPALFFFEGASDYIGSVLSKKGLIKKRFETAFSWAVVKSDSGDKKTDVTGAEDKKKSFLPTGKFPGWKSIRTGTSGSFFFLFVSISGKSNLRTMLGENGFNTIKNRLRDVLLDELWEADALLWMETEGNSLFLIPPRAINGRNTVEAVMKMLLNSQLISIEDLGLSIKIDFTFALHYGETIYQAPGKTGAVISETVNYIFHLGTKKAETGRLTISESIPDEAITDNLKDFFRDAGIFEKIPIRHSRRFI
jgi:hypothetical protein